jgi:hypothetical protein
VLGLLVDQEPVQASLLEKICTGPLISAEELHTADAVAAPPKAKGKGSKPRGPDLFGW